MGRSRSPARDQPRSCIDCLAWGVLAQVRCRACRSFRSGYPGEQECTGCGRRLRVKNGYCRQCWVQLSGGRAWEGTTPKAVTSLTGAGTKITHHQLFFDKMAPRKGAGPQSGASRRAHAGTAPPPGRAWVQLDLLAPPARPRRMPEGSPSLTAAIRLADGLAEARGWSAETRRRVRHGLALALAGRQEGQDVRWSQALPLLRAERICAGHVAEVLQQMSMLCDDRPPAFDAWLDRKLDGMTSGIRRDVERWLRTLKDGGPAAGPAASRPSTATWAKHCPP